MAAEKPPCTAYRFDRFTLDLAAARCWHLTGRSCPCGQNRSPCCSFLVENAGRLLDRDTIMQAVWPDVFVTDDSITQCVRDIRRALGDEAQRLLRTVPRRGYLFAAEVSRAGPVRYRRQQRPQASIGQPAVARLRAVREWRGAGQA